MDTKKFVIQGMAAQAKADRLTRIYEGLRVYAGVRGKDGLTVLVNGIKLEPERSLKVFNHSPDGFEWGYGGSGPSQLALAILLDYTNDENLSVRLHHPFLDKYVSKFPKERWQIVGSQIDTWLQIAKLSV